MHHLSYYNSVPLNFGTTIPTFFNILMKCFLHLYEYCLLSSAAGPGQVPVIQRNGYNLGLLSNNVAKKGQNSMMNTATSSNTQVHVRHVSKQENGV